MELYIHIPFCIKKCNYCDFLSFSCEERKINAYIEVLCEEIRESENLGRCQTVSSIFIGGGTPSILSGEQIGIIMEEVKTHFIIEPDAEVSMEANPGTLSVEKLKAYYAAGINRLSIGLQSTENHLLKRLGRIHTYEQFLENYRAAREVGFQNINIDLMSALPGQNLDDYKQTLEKILALEPEHISAYSLILEEGTPFYDDDSVYNSIPGEEEDRAMYAMTKQLLHESGYERYEISNYAKKGKECRHNLGYWDDVPYLGLGLGASSYYNNARFSNTRNLEEYLKKPYKKIEEREEYSLLEETEHIEEFMFMGLRKIKGVSIQKFENIFGKSIWKIYGDIIKNFMAQGLLMQRGDSIFLTDRGIDISNQIFSEFLL